jgi:hypothetical protein
MPVEMAAAMAAGTARYNSSVHVLFSILKLLTCRNSGLKAIVCERKAQWMRLSTQSTCDVEAPSAADLARATRNFPVLGI